MDRARKTEYMHGVYVPLKCSIGHLRHRATYYYGKPKSDKLLTFHDPEVTKAWLDSIAYCEIEEVEEESSPLTDEESTTLLSILCNSPGVTYTPRTKRTTKKTPVTVRDSLRKKD